MIVVMHVSPTGRSVLPAILSRVTPLRVIHAEHGMAVDIGTIHVAPPARHVLVFDGIIRVTAAPRIHCNRSSIDALFRTAARSRGAVPRDADERNQARAG